MPVPNESNKVSMREDTLAVHGGITPDPITGAMLTPLYQSVAFKQFSVDRYAELGHTYSRCSNPTVSVLEAKVAEMEGASNPAVIVGSGMAALNCLMASTIKSGDHIVVTRCSYGGTNRALRVLYQNQFGVELSFVDFTDLQAIKNAIIPGKTKMVFSETPCNPVLELADLKGISDLVHSYNQKNLPPLNENLQPGDGPSWNCLNGRILHVADTTLSPPTMCRGLDFGADIIMISLTKYYCGHNLNTGGALLSNDPDLIALIRFKQNVMGSIMAPVVAHQVLQTAKTLPLRVKKQSDNAMAIAKFLEAHPKVEKVVYPGLESHKQYELALRQHKPDTHGGLIAVEVKGGTEAGRRVMDRCKAPWTLAENLGAVESIMTCPAVFTHGNMPKKARMEAGITDGLIRLSVGVEDSRDLIDSLAYALSDDA